MSKINKDMFNDVSIYNLKLEKKELENIIKERKNELEKNITIEVAYLMNNLISNNKASEDEVSNLLNYFMKRIVEIERN